jgi:hypothetical protein
MEFLDSDEEIMAQIATQEPMIRRAVTTECFWSRNHNDIEIEKT